MRMRICSTCTTVLLLVSLNLFIPCTFCHGATAARPDPVNAELSAYGEVTVNGDPAESGTALFAGCTVATNETSSAIVSLGVQGRIELLPESAMKLAFDRDSVHIWLEGGTVRVSASRGVAVFLATKDGSLASDRQQASMFVLSTDQSTSFSRFAGILKSKQGDNFIEKPLTGFFRPSIVDSVDAEFEGRNKQPIRANPALAERVATLFIEIGAVFAAVTGLNSSRDASFFHIGGARTVDPANGL